MAQDHLSGPLGEDLELILDVLTLIGFDKPIYMKFEEMEGDGEFPLIPEILKRLFKHAEQTVKIKNKDQLRLIVEELVKLLMALYVDGR